MSTSNTLLIGSGRIARHLKHWLPQKTFYCWDRSQPVQSFSPIIKSVSHIWLAISDQAIVPFYEQHLANKTAAQVVHFSGALFDSRIAGAHPLMSFPEELFPPEIYNKIFFAVDDSTRTLEQLLPGFTNPHFHISADKKSLYHALCVAAGNFPQLLWSLCLQPLKDIQVPDQAFEIYLKQITDNFIAHKEKALTGPLVRNDFATIEKNIQALQNHEETSKIADVYKTFVGVYSNEN